MFRFNGKKSIPVKHVQPDFKNQQKSLFSTSEKALNQSSSFKDGFVSAYVVRQANRQYSLINVNPQVLQWATQVKRHYKQNNYSEALEACQQLLRLIPLKKGLDLSAHEECPNFAYKIRRKILLGGFYDHKFGFDQLIADYGKIYCLSSNVIKSFHETGAVAGGGRLAADYIYTNLLTTLRDEKVKTDFYKNLTENDANTHAVMNFMSQLPVKVVASQGDFEASLAELKIKLLDQVLANCKDKIKDLSLLSYYKGKEETLRIIGKRSEADFYLTQINILIKNNPDFALDSGALKPSIDKLHR